MTDHALEPQVIYPQMTDHTPKMAIIPWNAGSYPGVSDRTPNDRSYPGMTDHTLESQIIPWNDRSYHGMTDHTLKWQSYPGITDRTLE